MISQVPDDAIDSIWAHLEPAVDDGLAYGQGDSLASDDIYADLRSGGMILWIAHDETTLYGGIVLEVTETPRKKTLFIVLLVGSNKEAWADDLEAELFKYQELIGADCIEASCRKGLAQILKKRGWKEKAIIMEGPQYGR